MTFIFGAILFILIWWIVLFTILPFKIKSQIESGQIVESTDPGAPENPRIVQKFLIVTIISLMLWLGLYVLVKYEYLDLRALFLT
jgi:predicted secreted protein|tara:strand:+ start:579 stop:833 length:255 start_codon:yes stop_codon:yes gene_type:complete